MPVPIALPAGAAAAASSRTRMTSDDDGTAIARWTESNDARTTRRVSHRHRGTATSPMRSYADQRHPHRTKDGAGSRMVTWGRPHPRG
jgi:hypothetical protein